MQMEESPLAVLDGELAELARHAGEPHLCRGLGIQRAQRTSVSKGATLAERFELRVRFNEEQPDGPGQKPDHRPNPNVPLLVKMICLHVIAFSNVVL